MEIKYIVEITVYDNEKEVIKEIKSQGDWFVSSMGGNAKCVYTRYRNEFESLEDMKDRLNKIGGDYIAPVE